MFFDERTEGDYRIHAGALDAPRGHGYIAAVVVSRLHHASGRWRETFRDDSLHCGHRWPSAAVALSQAVNRARQFITQQRAERAVLEQARLAQEQEAAAEQD